MFNCNLKACPGPRILHCSSECSTSFMSWYVLWLANDKDLEAGQRNDDDAVHVAAPSLPRQLIASRHVCSAQLMLKMTIWDGVVVVWSPSRSSNVHVRPDKGCRLPSAHSRQGVSGHSRQGVSAHSRQGVSAVSHRTDPCRPPFRNPKTCLRRPRAIVHSQRIWGAPPFFGFEEDDTPCHLFKFVP